MLALLAARAYAKSLRLPRDSPGRLKTNGAIQAGQAESV
jgi:hypothetical protein